MAEVKITECLFQGVRSPTGLLLEHLQNSCLEKANLWRNPFTNCLISTSYQWNRQSVPALMGCYLEETLRKDCKLSLKFWESKNGRGLISPSWPLNSKLLIKISVFGTYAEQVTNLFHVAQLAKTTTYLAPWLGIRSSCAVLSFVGYDKNPLCLNEHFSPCVCFCYSLPCMEC